MAVLKFILLMKSLALEPDAVIELVSEYLDSLETSGKFISLKCPIRSTHHNPLF